jgi:hypothetical protein
MEVRVESMICLWDDNISVILAEVINVIQLSRTEEDIRRGMEALKNRVPLGVFFAYGFGRHHFWMHQRKLTDPTKVLENRLLYVEL